MASKRKQPKDDASKNEKMRKTEESTVKKELKAYADRLRRHVNSHGELPAGQMFKTLNNIQPNTVLEAHSYKLMPTSIGQAFVLDVTQTEEVDGKIDRNDFKLMIASRFEEEIISKVPCLLYYRGKQPMANGNLFHDLQAFTINYESVFQNNSDMSKPSTKSKKRTPVVTSSNVLDESLKELYTHSIPCDNCKSTDNANWCYGFCTGCGTHQPFDGSQCPCY